MTKASATKRPPRSEPERPPAAAPTDPQLAKALALRAAGNIGAARAELAKVEQSGSPSAAEAGRLRRALAINPHDAKARVDLGAILTRQGRFREARAELEQVLPRVDDLPDANYYLGLCLMNDGVAERGRSLVERALAMNPKFGYGEPYLRLGDFHAERSEWAPAAERYRQAVDIYGSSVEGWSKLGRALIELGRKEEARQALEEVN